MGDKVQEIVVVVPAAEDGDGIAHSSTVKASDVGGVSIPGAKKSGVAIKLTSSKITYSTSTTSRPDSVVVVVADEDGDADSAAGKKRGSGARSRDPNQSGTLRTSVVAIAHTIYAALIAPFLRILVPAAAELCHALLSTYNMAASVFCKWVPSIAVRGMVNSNIKFVQTVLLTLGLAYGANIKPSDDVLAHLPARCPPSATYVRTMQMFTFKALAFPLVELLCCYLVRKLLDGTKIEELPSKTRILARVVMRIAVPSNTTAICYTVQGLCAATELKVGFMKCQTPGDLVGVGIGFVGFVALMVTYHVVDFGNALGNN